ncbi:MAG TPA: DUF1571 domain-containing protein [Gemmataceae bacterium]
MVLILVSVSAQHPTAPTPPARPGPQPVAGDAGAAAGLEGDPMPGLIARAQESYRKVRDYTCTFVKQERVGGRLLPEQTARMYARTEPFSVYFEFLSPRSVAGQEACYVAGANGGKMRVKGNGWKSALGFVSLDLDDPRVTRENRHTIAEAGIGPLIAQIARAYAAEKPARVRAAPYRFGGRLCTRVEMVAPPDGKAGYAHRSVVYFDRETGLPLRFEAYDRPRPGGPPEGELLECYSYLEPRFNVNLPDATFQK